ncbi:uncharacterized protein LOC107640715 [Arachis ipaensis]|uniref:uncharacterized protein LOC107640715 n=1 Tax=Arachis ipaensis TaxID=130454 RepID=UPI0007AF3EE2|nr:uncharacterized protein LOC107640715 [Arachis ipaensis]XP_025652618.1 uncharacterized protein LOC112748604 [Arachis hypogaea]
MEYVSKWVDAIATTTCDAQIVLQFLKKYIFTRFRVPKGLINDGGSHFCNKQMNTLLHKYGVTHKVATPYHPPTNGQAELANRELKKILEKTVGATRKDWARKLDDALWAYRTAFKTPIERLEAYDNAKIYKDRTKRWHDKKISKRDFKPGQQVLVYNSRLKIFPGKLKSKWTSPYVVTMVSPHGNLELLNEASKDTFTINSHRVKHYLGGPWNKEEEHS